MYFLNFFIAAIVIIIANGFLDISLFYYFNLKDKDLVYTPVFLESVYLLLVAGKVMISKCLNNSRWQFILFEILLFVGFFVFLISKISVMGQFSLWITILYIFSNLVLLYFVRFFGIMAWTELEEC
jgi:hypothetical protein